MNNKQTAAEWLEDYFLLEPEISAALIKLGAPSAGENLRQLALMLRDAKAELEKWKVVGQKVRTISVRANTRENFPELYADALWEMAREVEALGGWDAIEAKWKRGEYK